MAVVNTSSVTRKLWVTGHSSKNLKKKSTNESVNFDNRYVTFSPVTGQSTAVTGRRPGMPPPGYATS